MMWINCTPCDDHCYYKRTNCRKWCRPWGFCGCIPGYVRYQDRCILRKDCPGIRKLISQASCQVNMKVVSAKRLTGICFKAATMAVYVQRVDVRLLIFSVIGHPAAFNLLQWEVKKFISVQGVNAVSETRNLVSQFRILKFEINWFSKREIKLFFVSDSFFIDHLKRLIFHWKFYSFKWE